jgi:DNA-binding NtrC family response regulator
LNVPNSSNTTHLDVLVVSEKPDHLRAIITVLGASSARVSACFTVRQAQEIFTRQSLDLVFCDEYLSDGTYRDLLLSSRFGQNAASFILLLHKGEWEEYLTAMRLGAMDVLRSPLHRPDVETVIRQAFERKETQLADLTTDGSLKPSADMSVQDLAFEEMLEKAAATLNPRSSTAGAASNTTDHRPGVVRRDVA